jgi:hypothetical protein
MTLHSSEPSLQVRSEIGLMCSARGCRSTASWGLKWNNPKLHTPDRRKTWLACDAHRESLQEFLSMRGFLRETVPVSELRPTLPD